ncbi:Putative FYVE zinc finger, Zinc finger, FYVE/PHD-type, Zinc finger, RING/FYVE/PHD-type [Colletotrichum destructivum]|uniref:FYVE zinc finger, Zinc finger, FYVE/PHD-type, Zinc finger, RING/FYVE/PHD-type n=1 Tax=Colletotrichum destructivum TaxID=34406 RepID=A0AAX4ICS9_9PEZI|nr:Putative FYVE zinc finger, Zinc finger, FYVE/PHD-type, Zinc finger, RING/FYVE/PHD-type [Colletotrichum destructivum]
MSGRKLGGGRILGSGKGLAPPTPPAVQGHRRTPSPFAPSESTLSLNSSSASPPVSSPLPDFAQDLTSNISVGGPSRTATAGSKLVCPICEEEMLTLLQLNRHIDDNHQELPEVEQDEVRTWFDKQVLKAKRFQPLSIINQKLRGLDVFESNESMPVAPPAVAKLVEGPIDPDELITRSHWQRQTSNDRCTDPTCAKGLGAVNGSINCRNCGRLFCEEHTMYQMRLSRSAQHDPVRGYWVRVCETCYKSRDGYNDHNGVLVDHTSAFAEMRRKRVERQNLEAARLEKRLTKLTQLLANAPEDVTTNGGNLLSPVATLTGQKSQRKLLEQSVVTWEDDASVTQCPFCQQEFGSWTFRRHHCRICGRVVCADPLTGCSSEVGLSIASRESHASGSSRAPRLTAPATSPATEKPPTTAQPGQLSVDVRMCRGCNHTIFSKRDFAATLVHKPPDQRAYETLRQFERGIRQLMPIFQRTLLALQPEGEDGSDISKAPPTHAQIQEASKIRKRLTDAFTKYDMAARRLRDMKTTSKTQLRLQQAVYAAASSFLHTHMLTLKSVPQILRARSSQSSRLRALQSGSVNGSSSSLHLSPLRNQELAESETASQASETSTAVSALETEEKEARERLVVLEEQRFMVQQMVDAARDARRFEEVSALTRNVEELDREIERAKKMVGGVEERWEGLYASGLAR